MSEFNPTTDQPWVYEEDSFGSQVIYTGEKEEGKWIAQIRGWGWIQKLDDAEKRQDDNGKLIADAGNTYHATGMTPSQLAERVKVLEDALRHLHHNAKASGANMGLALDVAKEALAK